MKIQEIIQNNLSRFSGICQSHDVQYLYAFGSSVTDQFSEQHSDIDLLVDIKEEDPLERGDKLLSLSDHLENYFGRRIGLLTNNSVKNPVLRSNIDRTKVLIYDGERQKVPG
jgi:predicted nucleotidyltransferase